MGTSPPAGAGNAGASPKGTISSRPLSPGSRSTPSFWARSVSGACDATGVRFCDHLRRGRGKPVSGQSLGRRGQAAPGPPRGQAGAVAGKRAAGPPAGGPVRRLGSPAGNHGPAKEAGQRHAAAQRGGPPQGANTAVPWEPHRRGPRPYLRAKCAKKAPRCPTVNMGECECDRGPEWGPEAKKQPSANVGGTRRLKGGAIVSARRGEKAAQTGTSQRPLEDTCTCEPQSPRETPFAEGVTHRGKLTTKAARPVIGGARLARVRRPPAPSCAGPSLGEPRRQSLATPEGTPRDYPHTPLQDSPRRAPRVVFGFCSRSPPEGGSKRSETGGGIPPQHAAPALRPPRLSRSGPRGGRVPREHPAPAVRRPPPRGSGPAGPPVAVYPPRRRCPEGPPVAVQPKPHPGTSSRTPRGGALTEAASPTGALVTRCSSPREGAWEQQPLDPHEGGP